MEEDTTPVVVVLPLLLLRLELVFESLLEWERAYDAKGPAEDHHLFALLREASRRDDDRIGAYGLANPLNNNEQSPPRFFWSRDDPLVHTDWPTP